MVLNSIFPLRLKWKPLLRRHVMISVNAFSPEIKTINSSVIKSMYIFISFITFTNSSIAKYDKGQISVPRELSNRIVFGTETVKNYNQ